MKKFFYLIVGFFFAYPSMAEKPSVRITFSFQKDSITSPEIKTTIEVIKKRLEYKKTYNKQAKIYSDRLTNGDPVICIEIFLSNDDPQLINYLCAQGKIQFHEVYLFPEIQELINTYSILKDSLFVYLQDPPEEEKYNQGLFKYCKSENKNKVVQLLSLSEVKEILENKNIYFAWGKSTFSSTNQSRLYAIHTNPFLTQKNIQETKEKKTNSYSNEISLSLDSVGTSIFKNKTSKNINKYIAISWDDEVFSAPMVMQEIPGGKVSITGLTDDLLHSNDIVFILESGVLPSKMNLHSINSISKK